MPDAVLRYAKAWAALIGAIVQVVLPFLPADDETTRWFQIGFAVLTAIAVYSVPNKPAYESFRGTRVDGPDYRAGGPGDTAI